MTQPSGSFHLLSKGAMNPTHDDSGSLGAPELASALQYVPVGITLIDRQLSVRFWNRAFCAVQDFPERLMRPGVPMADLFRYIALRGDYGPGDTDQQVSQRIALALKFEPHHFTRKRADGVVLEIMGRPILGQHGEAVGFVTIYQDVTTEKQYKEQLETKNNELLIALSDLRMALDGNAALQQDRSKYYQLAVRDPLTNMFTRYYMEDTVTRMIELHERSESDKLGVLAFDIDKFKSINDKHGHLAGDAVLQRVAALFLAQVRKVDVPVRLGGDEFLIFLAGVGQSACAVFAERMRRACAELHFEGELAGLAVTVSVGVTEHRRGESLRTLIERADAALYASKREGRDRVTLAG
jgi:diguanylate cyclase (GGDEF)-like protein